MAKFDLKNLKNKPLDVKSDVEKVEKNRIDVEKETPKVSIPVKKAPAQAKKETEKKTPVKTVKKEVKTTATKPVTKQVKEAPAKEAAEQVKKETLTKTGKEPTKVVTLSLPVELRTYLKVTCIDEDTHIHSLINDMIEKKQKQYESRGVDVSAPLDPDAINLKKGRKHGSNPKAMVVRLTESQHKWIKRAALLEGLNVSQFMEMVIDEYREK